MIMMMMVMKMIMIMTMKRNIYTPNSNSNHNHNYNALPTCRSLIILIIVYCLLFIAFSLLSHLFDCLFFSNSSSSLPAPWPLPSRRYIPTPIENYLVMFCSL